MSVTRSFGRGMNPLQPSCLSRFHIHFVQISNRITYPAHFQSFSYTFTQFIYPSVRFTFFISTQTPKHTASTTIPPAIPETDVPAALSDALNA